MAKQTKGSPQTIIDNEQFSDIILIMDRKELSVRAVAEIDKNGKAMTVDADEKNQQSFLRSTNTQASSKTSSPTSGASSKNPRFNLFRITLDEVKNSRRIIQDIKAGKQHLKPKSLSLNTA